MHTARTPAGGTQGHPPLLQVLGVWSEGEVLDAHVREAVQKMRRVRDFPAVLCVQHRKSQAKGGSAGATGHRWAHDTLPAVWVGKKAAAVGSVMARLLLLLLKRRKCRSQYRFRHGSHAFANVLQGSVQHLQPSHPTPAPAHETRYNCGTPQQEARTAPLMPLDSNWDR